MKRLAALLITALVVLVGTTSSVSAGGGDFYVPVNEPVPEQPVVECTNITAPDLSVTSPTDNQVNEDPTGVWLLYLLDQNINQWAVEWSDTSGAPSVSYMFEVSNSPEVDASGAFVSPIAAYSVNGTGTQSTDMNIDYDDTFYFHVKADSPDRCPGEYSPVEQITATYRLQPPSEEIELSTLNLETPILISTAFGLGASAVSRKRSS